MVDLIKLNKLKIEQMSSIGKQIIGAITLVALRTAVGIGLIWIVVSFFKSYRIEAVDFDMSSVWYTVIVGIIYAVLQFFIGIFLAMEKEKRVSRPRERQPSAFARRLEELARNQQNINVGFGNDITNNINDDDD